MATMSKSAFGAKENLEAAKSAGKVDSFDVAYLSNGEIAWIAKDGNTVFNTPRTQAEVTVESIAIPAGSTIEEVLALMNSAMEAVKASAIEEANRYSDEIAATTGNEVIEF